MENNNNKAIRIVIQLVFAFALLFLAFIESVAVVRIVYVLLAVTLLPIRPLDEFLENRKITLGTRIYLSTVIFIVLSGLFFFGK